MPPQSDSYTQSSRYPKQRSPSGKSPFLIHEARPCSAAGSEERAPRRLRNACDGANNRATATTAKTTRARSATRRLQGGVALVPRLPPHYKVASRAPITPKALHLSAQGCEARATLGHLSHGIYPVGVSSVARVLMKPFQGKIMFGGGSQGRRSFLAPTLG